LNHCLSFVPVKLIAVKAGRREFGMGKGGSVFQKLCRFLQSPTQPSLFHYIRDTSQEKPFIWKEFFSDIFGGFRYPSFIPSVLEGTSGSLVDRNQLRKRKMEAAAVSVMAHASILLAAILLVHQGAKPTPPIKDKDIINIVLPFFDLPSQKTLPAKDAPQDKDGLLSKNALSSKEKAHGGGGGGMGNPEPPQSGGLPNATKDQWLPPELGEPRPLLDNDAIKAIASVVMPFEREWDRRIEIGDVTVLPNNTKSAGPGRRGGIGTGTDGGDGPGSGPGAGIGKDGGYGGGGNNNLPGPRKSSDTVIKSGQKGLKQPEIIVDAKPEYTEAARKARIEGIVRIQGVVRKDGHVDDFLIIRGLGYGLDDSAIRTIASKWRFKPGLLNGVPVDVQVNFDISFKLY
jgi:periplasmic protein TonB